MPGAPPFEHFVFCPSVHSGFSNKHANLIFSDALLIYKSYGGHYLTVSNSLV